MDVSWKKYMQVGLVHFMAFPEVLTGEGPVLETLDSVLTDDFFDVIEITTIRDPEVRKAAREMLVSSKIVVTYGSQPVQLVNKLDLNSLDADTRQAAIDRCLACVDEAVEMGCRGVAFLSGPHPGEEKRQAATDLLVDSFDRICSHADAMGDLKVVVETFDFDIDKKALIGPNAEAVSFSARVRQKHDNFGLMLDLSHLPLQRETTRHALHVAKDHLVHAHMGNCLLYTSPSPRDGLLSRMPSSA